MYYSLIRSMDVSNGPGIRVSLFVSGCKFHCPECFNLEAQSFTNGQIYTKETQRKIELLVRKPHIRGLSILGGDPLHQSFDDINECLLPLADMAHYHGKDVWIWSGFTWEEIIEGSKKKFNLYNIQEAIEHRQWEVRKDLLLACDVFVDGLFDINKKDITLPYCGSSNQRVIDIHSTLKHYYEDRVIDLW